MHEWVRSLNAVTAGTVWCMRSCGAELIRDIGREKVINVLDLDYRSLVLAIFCLKWQLYAIFLTFSLDLSSARENSPWLLGKEESLKPYFWEISGLYVDSLENLPSSIIYVIINYCNPAWLLMSNILTCCCTYPPFLATGKYYKIAVFDFESISCFTSVYGKVISLW